MSEQKLPERLRRKKKLQTKLEKLPYQPHCLDVTQIIAQPKEKLSLINHSDKMR